MKLFYYLTFNIFLLLFIYIYINDNQLDNRLDENSRRIIKIHPNIYNLYIYITFGSTIISKIFFENFMHETPPLIKLFYRMSSIGSGYDLSAGQFSPDGRVFQVEYAIKAVENSGSVIALRGKDGVVFGVEKIITSKLYEEGSNRRVHSIDTHIGAAVAGLLSDARAVVNRARDEAANYRNTYQVPIPLKSLTERLGKYIHHFTVYGNLRPFGVR